MLVTVVDVVTVVVGDVEVGSLIAFVCLILCFAVPSTPDGTLSLPLDPDPYIDHQKNEWIYQVSCHNVTHIV